MKKYLKFKQVFLLSLLAIIICTSCTTKETGITSDAASKIAPLFESAEYQADNSVLPYRFYNPSIENVSDAKYPIILYLHGEIERGKDNEAQLTATECATIWVEADHLAKNPVYVLAPQIPQGSDWTQEPYYSNTLALLNQFIHDNPKIDQNRIYIVGFSMGGTGVWNMILKNPGLFAAAMPISGNADTFLGNYDAFAAVKNLPVLVVHSIDDPISPVSGSNNAIAALQNAGNRSVGSNTSIWTAGSVIPAHDAWYPAFHNYDVIYNWIFEQSLERTANGTISPTTLFSTRDLGNGVKEVWDYSLGTAYIIERSDKAIIIDAAAGDGNILQFIKDNVLVNKDIDIEIIITHNHGDHIAGLRSFVGATQLKKVYVHLEDSESVKRMLGVDSGKIQFIGDGDVIPLNGKDIEVINVPGHTWGSIILRYENNLYIGDAIGSSDVWLGGAILSIEDYIKSVQHLLGKIGNDKLSVLGGHTGEFRFPMTEEYPRQVLVSAKGLVDGSIIGVPYRRTTGYAGTYGRATIVYNLNNVHTIKGALRSLTISNGTLNPRFAPYTSYYSTLVEANIESVLITPTVLADVYEGITINGSPVDSGVAFDASLQTGENRFLIIVTASDSSTKTYTLTITRNNN